MISCLLAIILSINVPSMMSWQLMKIPLCPTCSAQQIFLTCTFILLNTEQRRLRRDRFHDSSDCNWQTYICYQILLRDARVFCLLAVDLSITSPSDDQLMTNEERASTWHGRSNKYLSLSHPSFEILREEDITLVCSYWPTDMLSDFALRCRDFSCLVCQRLFSQSTLLQWWVDD